MLENELENLTAETVEGAALAFEGVDDVHGGDRLPLGVFRVGDGVTDHVLEEHLENTASFLVDETGDALDTATTGKTADGRLRDALDVVTQNFAMAFRASLSESFSSFAASSHFLEIEMWVVENKLMEILWKSSGLYTTVLYSDWLPSTPSDRYKVLTKGKSPNGHFTNPLFPPFPSQPITTEEYQSQSETNVSRE